MACEKFRPEWVPTPLLSSAEVVRLPRSPRVSPPTALRRALAIALFALRWGMRDGLRWLRLLFNKREHSSARAVEAREFAERMGGMWIILAHLAALRSELFGEAFCRELMLTRDRARPVPLETIRQIIDEELQSQGTSFDEEFTDFAEQPMSTKSFGQFHQARLKKTGHQVSVRVRAPDAVQRAASDWWYMRGLAFILRYLDLEPHLRLDDLFFEVKLATDDLLDFRTEVAELKKIRKVLQRRRIYVPLIFSRICSQKLLVVEYIQGVSISDLKMINQTNPDRCDAWFRENNIARNRVWQRMFNMHHELLFEHSLFYTELYSKNVLLLKDDRIAFVNFCTIGTIDAELQRKYTQFCRAILARDFTKASETYLTMGPALPYKDITGMKLASSRALRNWESRTYVKRCSYHDKSLAAAVALVARSASEDRLPTFWNLARLQRAEDILGDSLAFLDSAKNGLKALRNYEEKAQLRVLAKASSQQKGGDRINTFTDIAQLNIQLSENFEHDGEYLRQRLRGFQGQIGRLSQVVGRLLRTLSRLALLGFGVEIFIDIKNRYALSFPFFDHGTMGRIFATLQIHNRAAWVAIVMGLAYLGRFLARLAKQLSSTEIRPADVL